MENKINKIFKYANNYKDFKVKNELNNCQEVKDMYEFCRKNKNYKHHHCNYLYDMSFVCLKLKYDNIND